MHSARINCRLWLDHHRGVCFAPAPAVPCRQPSRVRNNPVNSGCYKPAHWHQAIFFRERRMDETELLRMPRNLYMNDTQLEFFRARLQAWKEELARNASATSEHLRATEVVTDPSDKATQEEERGIQLSARDRERKLVHKIDQALARIEQG